MFPLNSNTPYINDTGERARLGQIIGGENTLPTASTTTKGGVKIGSGLQMTGEVLSAVQVPSYAISDAGKVLTVGEDGSLEWDTKGAGGGDAFLSYDFTKFINRTWGSATCAADGATISGYTSYIPILSGVNYSQLRDITIYIDSTELNVDATRNAHQRAVMGTTERGLIYERDSHKWSLYSDAGWQYGTVSDPDIFDNSKIKLYIDSTGKWTVYSNDVLVIEGTSIITITDIRIGASENGITSATIKGVRIYPGNYTE